MKHPRLSLTALLCLLLAPPAPAAAPGNEWPVPRGPSNEPLPYAYDHAAWKDVPAEFLDDAPACVLYFATTSLVEPDGTTETITHEVTRLNSRKAIENLGQYHGIYFNPDYEKATLHTARVHKPDGSVVEVKPIHTHLRDAEAEDLFYDHSKQLVISFPQLEVGDVYEVKWTVRGRHPEYGGHFFAYHTFGDPDHPTVREELRVRLPRDRPLKHAAVNAHLAGGKLGPEVTEADGQRLYRWVASNLKRVPGDPDLPPQEEFQPLVACSTFQSWEEVGEWERALRAECWECAPEMRKVVHEVTKDLKTPLEKVRALTGWVRRNIRYVSVGARHDFTPHPASRTFADRFGDCKDSSQLLAAMLREVGVPAAMVTLGFRGDGQIVEGVPSPWGTHAILLVTLDGKDHWIDPATSLAAWDFLPPEDCDRVAYAVGPAGVRVLRTPKMTPGDNRTVQETTVDVRPDGSTLQTRAAAYHGLEAWTRRHDWFEEPAGEVRRLIAEEVQEAQPGARLESYALDPGSLRDFDGPVKAWVTFENPRHFTGEEILEGSVSDGALWQPLLGPTIAFGRTVPMELPAPFESVHTFTFRAAPGTRLIDPPGDAIIVSKWGSFRRRVRAPDGPASQWRVEMRTRLERTRVEPSEFDAFRDFQDRVLAGYRVYATVRPATPEEAGQDAAKLRALYEKRPEDAETAARLARLLLTAGRAAEARDVLGRALKTHPDSLTLLELAADAADGVAGEIAAREKLFRLFPQRPSYRLDLAGALLRDGAFAKARDLLRPLAEDSSADIRRQAHTLTARSWLGEGKPGRALRALEAAEEADFEGITAEDLVLKGRVHEALAQPDDAAAAYQEAYDLDPEALDALEGLVRVAWRAGDGAEAARHLRRFTVAVEGDAAGLARAADWYLRLDRPGEAFDLAKQARGGDSAAVANRVLGLVHLKRGEADRAVGYLERAAADERVTAGLLECYLRLGRLSDAERLSRTESPSPALRTRIEQVKRLAARRDELRKSHSTAAVSDAALEAFVCAEHLLDVAADSPAIDRLLGRALAESEAFGPALALRGQRELERGQLRRARADAERATELCPELARAYLVRGRVRLECGDAKAVEDLEKAVALSQRGDAEALHWMAEALAEAGRGEEAARAREEAKRLRGEKTNE